MQTEIQGTLSFCHNGTCLSTHVKRPHIYVVFLSIQNKHFCILGSTYMDRNRKQLCSLLGRWLESVTTIN